MWKCYCESTAGADEQMRHLDMDVSKNNGTPKSSILIGFSLINHPFWGTTIFGNIHIFGLLKACFFSTLLGSAP